MDLGNHHATVDDVIAGRKSIGVEERDVEGARMDDAVLDRHADVAAEDNKGQCQLHL